MVFMMNKVVEEGTGRRALLDGVAAAGKTGTTNAYRDAWFVGYTGNFVCGVWFGNDDYELDQPHDRRLAAGDDLARRSWPTRTRASRSSRSRAFAVPQRRAAARSSPTEATSRATAAAAADPADQARRRVLVRVERMMEDASRALGPRAADGVRAARTSRPRRRMPDGAFASARWQGRAVGGHN